MDPVQFYVLVQVVLKRRVPQNTLFDDFFS